MTDGVTCAILTTFPIKGWVMKAFGLFVGLQTSENNYIMYITHSEVFQSLKRNNESLQWVIGCSQTDQYSGVFQSLNETTSPCNGSMAVTDGSAQLNVPIITHQNNEYLQWVTGCSQTDQYSEVFQSSLRQRNNESLQWVTGFSQTDQQWKCSNTHQNNWSLQWVTGCSQTDQHSEVFQSFNETTSPCNESLVAFHRRTSTMECSNHHSTKQRVLAMSHWLFTDEPVQCSNHSTKQRVLAMGHWLFTDGPAMGHWLFTDGPAQWSVPITHQNNESLQWVTGCSQTD